MYALLGLWANVGLKLNFRRTLFRAGTGNKTERQVRCNLCVEHDCLEVGKLHDSCLPVLAEVGEVGIAADDIVGTDGLGKRKKIEVLRVANGRRTGFCFYLNILTKRMNDRQQILYISRADVLADFVATGNVANLLNEAVADIHIEAHIRRKS